MNPNSEIALPSVGDGSGLGRRVAKNTAWLLVGRLGSQGLAMLFAILIARRLGSVGLGQYAFITSVIFLGNLTTTFGTDMLIIREMAAKREVSLLPAALILQLGLSVPFIILVFLVAPLLPNQTGEAILALQLYSLALLPLAFYSVFSSALRGMERMDSFTWLNLLNGSMLVGLGLLFIRPDTSVVTLSIVLLAVQTSCALAAALLCLAQIPAFSRAWQTSRHGLRRLVRLSAPIAVLGLLGAFYQRMAVYFLAIFQGAAVTGSFSAALRVMEAAKIGHIALLSALFPAMALANLGHVDQRAFQKIFSSSLNLLLALALLFAVVLFVFAGPLVALLYGTEFDSAVPVLQALAWVLIPVTYSYYLSLMLLAAKAERLIMLALAASTIVLAAFILLGLPLWGLRAVGWGMLIAESVQALILILSWRGVGIRSGGET
jgi:O-antigen/teichoic acid export membrane protein